MISLKCLSITLLAFVPANSFDAIGNITKLKSGKEALRSMTRRSLLRIRTRSKKARHAPRPMPAQPVQIADEEGEEEGSLGADEQLSSVTKEFLLSAASKATETRLLRKVKECPTPHPRAVRVVSDITREQDIELLHDHLVPRRTCSVFELVPLPRPQNLSKKQTNKLRPPFFIGFTTPPQPILADQRSLAGLCAKYGWRFCPNPRRGKEDHDWYQCEARQFVGKVSCAYIDNQRVIPGMIYDSSRSFPVHGCRKCRSFLLLLLLHPRRNLTPGPSTALSVASLPFLPFLPFTCAAFVRSSHFTITDPHQNNFQPSKQTGNRRISRFEKLAHNLGVYPTGFAHIMAQLPRLILLLQTIPADVPILLAQSSYVK